MIRYSEGRARIKHVITGIIYEIEGEELSWTTISDGSDKGNPEEFRSADVNHNELGKLHWEFLEKPLTNDVSHKTSVGPHILLENIDFGLRPEELGEFLPSNLYRFMQTDPAFYTRRGHLDDESEALQRWFHYYFKDPVYSLKSDLEADRERRVPGKSYDAFGVIRRGFSDVFRSAAITDAVRKIERNGTVRWIRTINPPDEVLTKEELLEEKIFDGIKSFDEIKALAGSFADVRFGDIFEIKLRGDALEKISELINSFPDDTRSGLIGHNNPPDESQTIEFDLCQVKDSLVVIESELSQPIPDISVISEKASKLQKILSLARGAVGLLIDATARLAASDAIKFLSMNLPWFWEKLSSTLLTLMHWILSAFES